MQVVQFLSVLISFIICTTVKDLKKEIICAHVENKRDYKDWIKFIVYYKENKNLKLNDKEINDIIVTTINSIKNSEYKIESRYFFIKTFFLFIRYYILRSDEDSYLQFIILFLSLADIKKFYLYCDISTCVIRIILQRGFPIDLHYKAKILKFIYEIRTLAYPEKIEIMFSNEISYYSANIDDISILAKDNKYVLDMENKCIHILAFHVNGFFKTFFTAKNKFSVIDTNIIELKLVSLGVVMLYEPDKNIQMINSILYKETILLLLFLKKIKNYIKDKRDEIVVDDDDDEIIYIKTLNIFLCYLIVNFISIDTILNYTCKIENDIAGKSFSYMEIIMNSDNKNEKKTLEIIYNILSETINGKVLISNLYLNNIYHANIRLKEINSNSTCKDKTTEENLKILNNILFNIILLLPYVELKDINTSDLFNVYETISKIVKSSTCVYSLRIALSLYYIINKLKIIKTDDKINHMKYALKNIINLLDEQAMNGLILYYIDFLNNLYEILYGIKLSSKAKIIFTEHKLANNRYLICNYKDDNDDIDTVAKAMITMYEKYKRTMLVKYIKHNKKILPLNEWFKIFIKRTFEISKCIDVFGLISIKNRYCNGLILINNEFLTDEILKNLKLLGIIIGNIILGHLGPLGFPFLIPFFTLLFTQVLSFEDVKYIDDISYEKWKNIKTFNNLSFPMTFIDIPKAGIKYEITANTELGIEEYEKQKVFILESISKLWRENSGFLSIRDGMDLVIDINQLRDLTGKEIFIMVNGTFPEDE
ncbi:hypothetical protein TCON_2197 [Astathelohania contejeani]|uniref:HECT domain-containing protein n=1 Tax=Astathelohania contejeani TaxID=164912 RepID=A0ABQ7HWP8_9MICR|nr:hypothetical protein TCON_2197 [Thelohania contejeani]